MDELTLIAVDGLDVPAPPRRAVQQSAARAREQINGDPSNQLPIRVIVRSMQIMADVKQ